MYFQYQIGSCVTYVATATKFSSDILLVNSVKHLLVLQNCSGSWLLMHSRATDAVLELRLHIAALPLKRFQYKTATNSNSTCIAKKSLYSFRRKVCVCQDGFTMLNAQVTSQTKCSFKRSFARCFYWL